MWLSSLVVNRFSNCEQRWQVSSVTGIYTNCRYDWCVVDITVRHWPIVLSHAALCRVCSHFDGSVHNWNERCYCQTLIGFVGDDDRSYCLATVWLFRSIISSGRMYVRELIWTRIPHPDVSLDLVTFSLLYAIQYRTYNQQKPNIFQQLTLFSIFLVLADMSVSVFSFAVSK